MQRIPTVCGRISAEHLSGIADLAVRYTGGTPLHLTTRQSIELHNVPDADCGSLLQELAAMGLSTLGAGGDNVRAITVCPCCVVNPEAFDIEPLAETVTAMISRKRPSYRLPRKFKISFFGCSRPESKPFINDLAFGAVNERTVRVIGAGSMGPMPQPGIVLYDKFAIADIGALIEAALALFDKYGNRQNRRQARLRHIRQRIGDDAFRTLLDDHLQQHKKTSQPLQLELSKGNGEWQSVTLQTIGGELPTDMAKLIAETASAADAQIRIDLRHGLNLCTKEPLRLPEQLQQFLNRPRIVACPGSTTCKNGLVNCRQAAAQLSAALKDHPGLNNKTIALSGCPNNCAHSPVAEIGLVGRLKTIDGQRQEAYQVLLGGDNGRSEKVAEPAEIALATELYGRIKGILTP